MSLVDLITYGAVVLYLFLAWLGRSRRRNQEAESTAPEREPSIEELQAWRQSLGIPEPVEEPPPRRQRQQQVSEPVKTAPVARIQHPKARVHQPQPKARATHRTMPHNFRFQATLDKYKRATNIDTRDFSSRIEARRAPVDELVSAQLKDDAPEDAYRLDKVEEKSLGWQTLQQVGSTKNLIIISELLGKPRAYLAPEKLPGHWWENQSR